MENFQRLVRFMPNLDEGLSDEQVKTRISQGLTNFDSSIKTKTFSEIVKSHVLTLFNFLNIVLAAAILYVGSYKNLMFMGVVICNCIIGIVQEVRAKKAVDSLNLISSKSVTAIRNGEKVSLHIEDIVKDDIILYSTGNQVASDCIILDGTCEVNESLLTGESNSITKKRGDLLLSGSFIVSGNCTSRVEHVGAENYVSTVLHGTKYIKNTESEIMFTIKKIIKIISILIIPIGALLFIHQLKANNFDYSNAVINTSAALIGMIPEGLVLLISTVLAVSVIRLSKYKVLVQDIYCIETLARVDMLCLDKTGTITTGELEVKDVALRNDFSFEEVSGVLSSLTHCLNDSGSTFNAVKAKFPPKNFLGETIKLFPFSSEKKWSGVYFKNSGFYAMGAAEFILPKELYENIKSELDSHSSNYRVLTLIKAEEPIDKNTLSKDISVMAFILIKDKLRDNAQETLKYFSEQNVDIKIISGDNPITVSNIAKSVCLKDYDKYIDATSLKTSDDIKNAVKQYTVFGRVTPQQKLEIIKSLKLQGHTVAMTGDGVNDVLALKEADCSIAIANGSDAARNVSHLVLLNSDFSSMPKVVGEGRRDINNIQRSSCLFLVKTIYSALLSLLFIFLSIPYPFFPIQMTLISTLTIGIPSFVLALEPNNELVKSNLFKNIINKSLPAALMVVAGIIGCIFCYKRLGWSFEEYSTISVILTSYVGFLLLRYISTPFNALRKTLFYTLLVAFAAGITVFGKLFSVSVFYLSYTGIAVLLTLCFLFYFLFRFTMKCIKYYSSTH